MPKYAVIITRPITESTVIEVEAADSDAAEQEGIVAMQHRDDVIWQIDEGSWNDGDPYVSHVSILMRDA